MTRARSPSLSERIESMPEDERWDAAFAAIDAAYGGADDLDRIWARYGLTKAKASILAALVARYPAFMSLDMVREVISGAGARLNSFDISDISVRTQLSYLRQSFAPIWGERLRVRGSLGVGYRLDKDHHERLTSELAGVRFEVDTLSVTRRGEKYNDRELSAMAKMISEGRDFSDIAAALQRPVRGVREKAREMGLTHG